jgi:hybrid cluster-associated redox disulfide protein
MKITEKTTVQDAMKISKQVTRVFAKYNLDCPGCRGSSQDTIEKAASNNGINLSLFLKDLNKAVAGDNE